MMNEQEVKDAAGDKGFDDLVNDLYPGNNGFIGDIDPRLAYDAGWQLATDYSQPDGETNEPLDVILFCPECQLQHIDKAEPDVCENCGHLERNHDFGGNFHGCCHCVKFTAWLNPSHKKHRCASCNHVWKAANVPTNGVSALGGETK
jgi:hypothetical protein